MMMAAKSKSAIKSEKKNHFHNDDLSHLAKAIISNAGVEIYIVQHGKFVYVSELYQKLTGYSETELIGTYSFNNIYPDDREMVREEAIKCLKGERFDPYEYRFVKKNNEVMWVLETITPIVYKEDRATLGSFMDITGRKLMEEQLRQSEEKYRTILQTIQEGYFEVDLAGNFTFFNDAMCRLYGYSKEEMMDMNYRVYTDKENAKKLFQTFNKVYKTGEPTEGFDWKIIRKNRTKIYIEASASLQKDSSGKPIGFKGIVRDVTERKLADAKLQQTLEILRKAVGTTTQVLISALEARDPYTAGHQVRSADLARAIATEMGLPHDKIDGIRLAGSIHDIGKLSIPAEILSKPSKLTNIEFSLIKEHSHSGYEMLKDMESRWPLAQIIYQHHERINGSGYPRNLKGDEIIIEARIMAVADVVESMASHRPYRPALGIDAALEEIEKNKGILYDNDVVDSCLRLFRKKGYSLILKNTWGRRGGCQ
jgi:PAS domain S-box-containing protein